MRKVFVLLAVAVMVSSPAFANFLVNGGFETGDLTGWTMYSSTWGGGDVRVQSDTVYEGQYALEMIGQNGSFGVVQAISTIPGQLYDFTGYWKGGGISDWMEVLFFNDDGRSLYDQLDAPQDSSIIAKVDDWGMNGPQPFDWEPITAGRWYPAGLHTNYITATGTTMYLALKAGTTAGTPDGVHAYFDGFICPVPEPSSVAGLIAGLGMMGLAFRRRRRI